MVFIFRDKNLIKIVSKKNIIRIMRDIELNGNSSSRLYWGLTDFKNRFFERECVNFQRWNEDINTLNMVWNQVDIILVNVFKQSLTTNRIDY
jgi:hypothetical protein